MERLLTLLPTMESRNLYAIHNVQDKHYTKMASGTFCCINIRLWKFSIIVSFFQNKDK